MLDKMKNQSLYRPKLWPTLSTVLGLRVSAVVPGPSLRSLGSDLEETFLDGAAAALTEPLLPSLLGTWVHVHGARLRTEKLALMARKRLLDEPQLAFWLTVFAAYGVSLGQSKWRVVLKEVAKQAKAYQPEDMALLAAAIGGEPWLAETDLALPRGALRIREGDVLSVGELASANEQYRLRLLYGADLRADIHWALHAKVTAPAQVKELVFCSQSAATAILNDIAAAKAALEARSALMGQKAG